MSYSKVAPTGASDRARNKALAIGVNKLIDDMLLTSATAKGIVELATDAETITGTDTERACTPANIQAKVASATAKGIVELATDAETITGTDTERACTPAGLQAYIDTVQDWIAPTLLNNWVNYGGGNSPAGYFKDKFGIVHLRGAVKDGTGISATYPIFILPVGYRPAYLEIFAISSNGAFGDARISTAGEVYISVGSTSWAALTGITFRAA